MRRSGARYPSLSFPRYRVRTINAMTPIGGSAQASDAAAAQRRPGRVLLAKPRGYCAGVDRAVQTVEKALDLYGAPVYVRK